MTETLSLSRVNSATQTLLETLVDGRLGGWGALTPHLKVLRVAAGATVFAEAETHPFVYVVRSGLVKLVYLLPDGTEWIKSFSQEGRFFSSIAALEPDGLTSFAVIAIEPTVLERLSYPLLAAKAEASLQWQRALTRAFQVFAARKEKRERELLTLAPEARYRAFLADSPDLARRVPQKDLARHLGITPVGLSRIRKRVGGR